MIISILGKDAATENPTWYYDPELCKQNEIPDPVVTFRVWREMAKAVK